MLVSCYSHNQKYCNKSVTHEYKIRLMPKITTEARNEAIRRLSGAVRLYIRRCLAKILVRYSKMFPIKMTLWTTCKPSSY